MKIIKTVLAASVFILPLTLSAAAQKSGKIENPPVVNTLSTKLKSSPAFAEIILRQTDLEAELEALLTAYTEEFPKVADLRFEIDALKTELRRIAAVKTGDEAKLTLALGKLAVRKAQLSADYWSLQKKHGDEYPDVKRAKRKVEIYENAIKEILN